VTPLRLNLALLESL